MKLKETSMNRLLKLGNEYGYMCITSDRQLPSKEDGYSQKERDDQKFINNKNRERLEHQIKSFGLSFVKVIGGYPEEGNESVMVEEQTFFLLNYDIRTKQPINAEEFKNIGISFAKEYNQDSVLILNAEDGKPTYYGKNGEKLFSFSGEITINDMSQIYYTCFQKSTKGRDKRYNGKDWRFTYVESCTTSKLNKWKIIKEDFTDKELVTIDSVDRILKRVWNDRVKGYTIFDGVKFECSDLDVASLVYSNSFQKYWLMGGKVNWSKPKKSPIDGEIHMYGTLPEDAFYDINLTLESVEKPMGYSKIKHFNFYKKF